MSALRELQTLLAWVGLVHRCHLGSDNGPTDRHGGSPFCL